MAKKLMSRRPAPKKKPRKAPAKAVRAKRKAGPKRGKDGNPAGWPTLAPYLTVQNGQASLEFYARAFGFKVFGEVVRDEDGQVQHAGMVLGGAAIMLGPPESSMGLVPPQGGADHQSIYVYVPDVDALADRARRAGASMVRAPADQPWQDRIAVFKDRDGYHWTFATHLR